MLVSPQSKIGLFFRSDLTQIFDYSNEKHIALPAIPHSLIL